MPAKTTPPPTPTLPTQRVAVLAKLAEQLVLHAETALRAHRGDIALVLMIEARAVLVSDLILGEPAIDVLIREAATASAHSHVRRVIGQRLNEEQRAALDRSRGAEHDTRMATLNASRLTALKAARG